MLRRVPAAVRKDWLIQDELPMVSCEAAHFRKSALTAMFLHKEAFVMLAKELSKMYGTQGLQALLERKGRHRWKEEEIAEMVFAFGPAFMTRVIGSLLSQASTSLDLLDIAVLMVVRHSMLEAFSS
jgi:hypothetical protein